MNRKTGRRIFRPPLALLSFMLAVACSRPAPEERLIDAGRSVSDAESKIQALGEAIESHESTLAQLKKERRRAQAQLMTLEERLERRATDLAIFRAVQSAMLDESTLQQSAVSANVEDGVVTLTGVVASADAERTARHIALDVPGVVSIISRLDIHEDSNGNPR